MCPVPSNENVMWHSKKGDGVNLEYARSLIEQKSADEFWMRSHSAFLLHGDQLYQLQIALHP